MKISIRQAEQMGILPKASGRKRHNKNEMNSLEERYAGWLEVLRLTRGDVSMWMFEAITLKLADRTTYTPDFMVMKTDGLLEMHDVKATAKNGCPIVEDDASVKMKVAANMFPFRFVIAYLEPIQGWKEREI